MVYNKEKAIEAWKTFVNSGEIIEGYVRPEIARSWLRCREAGTSPWSTDFVEQNSALLEEKREKFSDSLRATQPIMKVVMAMLGCNVSLMDGENFVFDLMSPLIAYPRTYGTFMKEEEVGTGNATVVAYEKKPTRVEGFEHYRAIAQNYTGVSAPYLDAQGKYYGALNLNSPFEILPSSALDICVTGVELSQNLYNAGNKMGILLSSVEFFKPLFLLYEDPVLILDTAGHILTTNASMRAYCPDWENYSYGAQSLNEYLSKKSSVKDMLSLPEKLDVPEPIFFKKGKTRGEYQLNLVRHNTVKIDGQEPFVVCVFEERQAAKPQKETASEKSNILGDRSATGAKNVDYIGESEEWKEIDRIVQKVASIKTNVLLLGETGTGKEVVARALHRRSGRKGEFVAVNCGAVPRDLLATELFGYEGGAFTGARESGAVGKFEFANGGTLFLDEIGEMPVDMQVSLLRVLQEQSVTKLGSNTAKPLDVRVIAATNQNIEQLIAEKKFRSDLYYRLSLVEMRLPQLRRRTSDVPLLVEYFNEQFSRMLNLPFTPFPEDSLNAFMRYSWPGNVRELRNMVERSLIMQGEGAKVTLNSLPPYLANALNVGSPMSAVSVSQHPNFLDEAMREGADLGSVTKEDIVTLVERYQGNLYLAAKELGVSSDEFSLLLERLHLEMRIVVKEVPNQKGAID